MSGSKRAARSGARILYVAGLGLDFPRHATLETLGALTESDTVASNLPHRDGLMDFLALFCKDIRTLSYRGLDDEHWADRVLGMLGPGKTVTFLTFGHALVGGNLAHVLIGKAREAGIEVRCLSSISTMDEALSLALLSFGVSITGLHVYDTRLLISGDVALQPKVATVVYFGVSSWEGGEAEVARTVERTVALVARAYPASHEVLLSFPPYRDRRVQRVAVGALGDALRAISEPLIAATVLYIPPPIPS